MDLAKARLVNAVHCVELAQRYEHNPPAQNAYLKYALWSLEAFEQTTRFVYHRPDLKNVVQRLRDALKAHKPQRLSVSDLRGVQSSLQRTLDAYSLVH